MSKHQIFKTTVLGVGPWCVEFPDGEIVYARTGDRAKLIAAAPEMLDALRALCGMTHENSADALCRARAVIDEATR